MRYEFASPDPYAHQLDALNRMVETKGRTALLMEPGTGKTRSVIDYLSLLGVARGAGEPVRALVVAPTAALDTWVEQAQQYAPDIDTANPVAVRAEVLEGSIEERAARLASFAHEHVPGDDDSVDERAWRDVPTPAAALHVAVVNLEAFSRRHAAKDSNGQPLATVTVLDRMMAAVRAWQPDVLVVDESHRIKSTTSNTSLAMMRLRDDIPRRLLLTGTVMPHSRMDVYAQWRTLAPEAFADSPTSRPWTAAQWRGRYAVMGGWQGKEIVGWTNVDDMEERMARNSIVVTKDDALDLPPTTDVTVHVRLSPRERKAYEAMRRDLALVVDGETASSSNRLVQMLRLRQLTSGHLPTDDGTVRRIGDSKVRTAAALAQDLLATERRLVVFAHFLDDVDAIAEAVGKLKGIDDLRVDTITGATPPAERTVIRKRFGTVDEQGDDRIVLVCQMRTMSLAVNELVVASHAIYASMSERRDDYVQSRDRLDRIGQTRPVTYHHLVAPGTVDEVMLDAHRTRSSVEEALLAHVRSVAARD